MRKLLFLFFLACSVSGVVAQEKTEQELKEVEETELVLKVLELSGVIVQDPGIIQYADQEDIKKIQQEKA